jgi:hypothetical protein
MVNYHGFTLEVYKNFLILDKILSHRDILFNVATYINHSANSSEEINEWWCHTETTDHQLVKALHCLKPMIFLTFALRYPSQAKLLVNTITN